MKYIGKIFQDLKQNLDRAIYILYLICIQKQNKDLQLNKYSYKIMNEKEFNMKTSKMSKI